MPSTPRPLIYDPATPSATRDLLRDLEANPNRLLGQNFLVNGTLLDKIADTAKLEKTDSVLEIGPGLGALTVRLVARAGQVVAIEKDARFAEMLRSRLEAAPFRLMRADALEVEWTDLEFAESGIKLVANLPYSISKPILRRILEDWRPHLETATILVQREVANRIVASPGTGDYGPMSIAASLYAEATKCFDISPGSFFPPPDVVSTVVHLKLRREPAIAPLNEGEFWKVVRAAFGQRRKTLANTLRTIAPRETLDSVFAALNLDSRRRGETLSLQEFASLSQALAATRS
jgi:16S rRNA (adenine1518-N6/adenine1519-N6)-dimethyltransferase